MAEVPPLFELVGFITTCEVMVTHEHATFFLRRLIFTPLHLGNTHTHKKNWARPKLPDFAILIMKTAKLSKQNGWRLVRNYHVGEEFFSLIRFPRGR